MNRIQVAGNTVVTDYETGPAAAALVGRQLELPPG
jgi:hypothetical protein